MPFGSNPYYRHNPLSGLLKAAVVVGGAALLLGPGRRAAEAFLNGKPVSEILGPPLDQFLSPAAKAQLDVFGRNLLDFLRARNPEKPFSHESSSYTVMSGGEQQSPREETRWRMAVRLPESVQSYEQHRLPAIESIIEDLRRTGKIDPSQTASIQLQIEGDRLRLDNAPDKKTLETILAALESGYERQIHTRIRDDEITVDLNRLYSMNPDGSVEIHPNTLLPIQSMALVRMLREGWASHDRQVQLSYSASQDNSNLVVTLQPQEGLTLTPTHGRQYAQEFADYLISLVKTALT